MRYEALDVQPTSEQGRTLNLSAGGVLILAHQPLPTGQRVRVVLALPGDDSPIEITGQVGRVRSLSDRVHEVAIEFVEGNIGVQRTLLDYIEERVATSPSPSAPCPPRSQATRVAGLSRAMRALAARSAQRCSDSETDGLTAPVSASVSTVSCAFTASATVVMTSEAR